MAKACSGCRSTTSSSRQSFEEARTMTDGSEQPLLEMIGISKSFGGVQALRDVDFSLYAGEIHGLVGENGAGKSTMMKIIGGVHHGYEGTMKIDGREVH